MSSPLNDPKLESLLNHLHAESEAQSEAVFDYLRRRALDGSLGHPPSFDEEMHAFFSDKMVALDKHKGEFCYQLCRSLGAARVVEAGTSFGVSTIYLAAAVRDNRVADGVVIGTEHEPKKADAAVANFEAAGLSHLIDLRRGDLCESLAEIEGPVDFMLADVWNVALPALELVAPKLRRGAIVVCDATSTNAEHYRDYFAFVNHPANRFRTMTLPFNEGFELTVRT